MAFARMRVATIARITIIAITTVIAITAATIIPIVAVMMMGYVHILIPVIADEIDWASARVVLAAVLTPVPFVTRRNAQVQRRRRRSDHLRLDDDHRHRKNKWRHGQATDIDVTVKARMTNRHRYTNVSGLGGDRNQGADR